MAATKRELPLCNLLARNDIHPCLHIAKRSSYKRRIGYRLLETGIQNRHYRSIIDSAAFPLVHNSHSTLQWFTPVSVYVTRTAKNFQQKWLWDEWSELFGAQKRFRMQPLRSDRASRPVWGAAIEPFGTAMPRHATPCLCQKQTIEFANLPSLLWICIGAKVSKAQSRLKVPRARVANY